MNKLTNLFGSLLFLIISYGATAQNNTESLYIGTGDTINTRLSQGFQYYFQTFRDGRIYFKNGTNTAGFLNYNILSNEIHFIQKGQINNQNSLDVEQKNSALKLTEPDIDFVSIDNEIFIYTHSGIMVVIGNWDVKLLQHDQIISTNEQQVGAYGQPIYTGAATSQSSIDPSGTTNSNRMVLKVNSRTEYKRTTSYYLYKEKKLYRANNIKAFYKAFPSIKKEINKFATDEKVNFNNQSDIKNLLKFCINEAKEIR